MVKLVLGLGAGSDVRDGSFRRGVRPSGTDIWKAHVRNGGECPTFDAAYDGSTHSWRPTSSNVHRRQCRRSLMTPSAGRRRFILARWALGRPGTCSSSRPPIFNVVVFSDVRQIDDDVPVSSIEDEREQDKWNQNVHTLHTFMAAEAQFRMFRVQHVETTTTVIVHWRSWTMFVDF